MKIKMCCAVVFAATLVNAATDLNAADLPDRNSARIDRLERIIDGLDQRVRQLESENGGGNQAAKSAADPLLGAWQCTNGIQARNMTFLANGQVVIEEPTLGSINKATWTRLDVERISIAGSVQYEIRFNSTNEFELMEVNRRSTGTCIRQ
jgi:hypothetical protein